MRAEWFTPAGRAEKQVVRAALRMVREWESARVNWLALDEDYSALAVAVKRLLKARKK